METLHLYLRSLKGLLRCSTQYILEMPFNVDDLCDFFASTKYFVEVVITCFYVQKRNEHGITVWIYNKR